MSSIQIRNFEQSDMPMLGEFYRIVTNNSKVVFWWVGPKENWGNVICAFENDQMIAKGQVEVINSISDGSPKSSRHSIYLNLKALPDRESDHALLNQLYEKLYARALELKENLNNNYKTNLCVGNFSTEVNNNQYFLLEKQFQRLNTLYTMKRDLNNPILKVEMPCPELEWGYWKMETTEEEEQYLKAERIVWPDNSLGIKRLHEYKNYPIWTAISVREKENIIASAMAWREDEIGVIEDVFVMEQWQKQGIAKFLLTEALLYLKDNQLVEAKLMVDTANEKALNLYKSVGFVVMEEEMRFFTELV